MKNNIILMSDAYKYTHWLQLPKGTRFVQGYVESRGTELKIPFQKFFGLQGFINEYLEGEVIEQWMIDEAAEVLADVFGTDQYFHKEGWEHILKTHGGRLPIKIRAVKEGTEVPLSNVMVTVENTDPEVPWLTQWLETMLLRAIWYPTTVCTISKQVANIYAKWAKACGAVEYHPFVLNDFGARGVSSHESAGIGGAAHLVNFLGTDTIEGIVWARRNYGEAHGYSVMASEHSTTTIYREEGEFSAYKTFLNAVPDDKIISIVIDSYDTERAVKKYLGGELKGKILGRAGKTVFRPDSGNPVTMSLKVVTWLWELFGGTTNEKGYKVLNPKVGVIYGDGINLTSIDKILRTLVENGFSVENIIFGMGGKLLQAGIDRDTFKYACKACWADINGYGIDIFKQPKTDSGKNSKRGRLELIKYNGEIKTVNAGTWPYEATPLLEDVFVDGKLVRDMTFEEVRNYVG